MNLPPSSVKSTQEGGGDYQSLNDVLDTHLMFENPNNKALSDRCTYDITLAKLNETTPSDSSSTAGDDLDRSTYVDQPIYACLTCFRNTGRPIGVCIGCMMNCHQNHELENLENRAAFRCDCGTDRCGDQPCQLCPTKPYSNPQNNYSQNFEGLFCICHKPYTEGAAMIACHFCEDWFHDSCLNLLTEQKSIKIDDASPETILVCRTCLAKPEVAVFYPLFVSINNSPELVASDQSQDIVSNRSDSPQLPESTTSTTIEPPPSASSPSPPPSAVNKRKFSELDSVGSVECVFPKDISIPSTFDFDYITNINWRILACDCINCRPLAAKFPLLFQDIEDVVLDLKTSTNTLENPDLVPRPAKRLRFDLIEDPKELEAANESFANVTVEQLVPEHLAGKLPNEVVYESFRALNRWKEKVAQAVNQLAAEDSNTVISDSKLRSLLKSVSDEARRETLKERLAIAKGDYYPEEGV